VEQARSTVEKTPQLLPVLREAGVVDAGGQGLLVILEGALKQLRGESLILSGKGVGAENLAQMEREEGWGYDIQFHILGPALDVDAIRARISGMGESALIVGDESLVKVHVHAPNPGDIIKYAADQGPLVNIILENMQAQYADFMKGHTADQRVGAENLAGGRPAAEPRASAAPHIKSEELAGIATIAVVPGSGLARIYESLGVGAIVGGGPTMNPSTQDILDAVRSVKSDQVLILPNDKNIILAANQARQLSDKRIEVIPTRTVPEGIAALLAFNFTSGLEENLKAMTEAARKLRTVELTRATRAAKLNGLDIGEGQYIGLIDGELVAAGDDRNELAVDLLRQAGADESDIMTVYYGSDLGSSDAEDALQRFKQVFPDKEFELHSGGQPLYPFIISVE
jgi:DAK2 domain fusion protein YloV